MHLTSRDRIFEAAGTYVLVAFAAAALVTAAVALPGIALSNCERLRCTPVAPPLFWGLVILLPAATAAIPCTLALLAPPSGARGTLIIAAAATLAACVIAPVIVVVSYV